MTTFENITKTRQKAAKNSNGDGSLKHTHGSTNHKRKEDKAAMLIATADEILQKGLEIDCVLQR
jgi:hypothetical protein